MKRNMKLIGLAACLISCTSLAVAQENPEPQERQQHEQASHAKSLIRKR